MERVDASGDSQSAGRLAIVLGDITAIAGRRDRQRGQQLADRAVAASTALSMRPAVRPSWPSCAAAFPTERRPARPSRRPPVACLRGGSSTPSGPVWGGGRSGEAELLASAYRSAVRLADELGATSLTLPAISAGIYGYPLADAARIAVATTQVELHAAATLREITFVLRDATLAPFRSALVGVR